MSPVDARLLLKAACINVSFENVDAETNGWLDQVLNPRRDKRTETRGLEQSSECRLVSVNTTGRKLAAGLLMMMKL